MSSTASLSIRQRHLLIIAAVIVGFVLVAMAAQFSNNKLQTLNSTQLDLQTLRYSLQTLRRNEKDFLHRKDIKEVEKFDMEYQRALSTTSRLEESLQGILTDHNISSVKQYITDYANAFSVIVEQQQKIGLDHKSGHYGSLRAIIHKVEELIKDDTILMQKMLMLRRHEKDFMLRRDKKYLTKFNTDFENMQSMVGNQTGIAEKLNAYKQEFLRLYEAEALIGLTHNNGLKAKMRESAHALESLFEEQATMLEASISKSKNRFEIIFFSMLITLCALASITVYIISSTISTSIDKLITHVRSLTKHQSSASDEPDTNNELTILENAFNTLNSNLSQAIGEVRNSAENISGVANELVSATKNVNRFSSDQHGMIEQSAAAMEQMSTSIQEVAKNASDTSNFVSNINDRLSDATQISANAQDAIESLKSELTNSVTAISSLQDTSENIDTLLDSIEAIANQTNLLALNAAIESARAGEYGRGFSVVADEVRTLSFKTSAATDEVRKTMDEFKRVIATVVEAVKSSNSKGASGQSHANTAIEMMRDMTQKVAEISMMNLQIATSVEEQSTAAESLNQHIHSIFESSMSVREANESTNSATQKLEEVVAKINESASVFAV